MILLCLIGRKETYGYEIITELNNSASVLGYAKEGTIYPIPVSYTHLDVYKRQPMQTINLKQYYPFCKEDIFVEVSDEIVEAFLLDKRAEAARERKMFRYKAFYSLDCNDGIENAAIGWAQPSPEDHLIEKEELALSLIHIYSPLHPL